MLVVTAAVSFQDTIKGLLGFQWLQVVAAGPFKTARLAKRPSRYHPKSLNLRFVYHWLRQIYLSKGMKRLLQD